MDSEIRQIQLKCLELLKTVDKICRKHGIEYSLCGGSVVGAHLYNGCLPWDDDIDLMMTRKNYNLFISIARKELPPYYSIHNYQLSDDFSTPFTKVMNDKTTIVQQDGTVSGVFLDITVYDRIPTNFLSKIDFTLWKISQIVMIGKVTNKGIRQKMRNILLNTVLSDRRKFLIFFERCICKLAPSKNYVYSELFGAFANTVPFPPAVFENYIDIEFEGGRYRIIRDYVEYLQTRYNRTDFREPKEKQVAPHYLFVDFELPYKSYVGNTR